MKTNYIPNVVPVTLLLFEIPCLGTFSIQKDQIPVLPDGVPCWIFIPVMEGMVPRAILVYEFPENRLPDNWANFSFERSDIGLTTEQIVEKHNIQYWIEAQVINVRWKFL